MHAEKKEKKRKDKGKDKVLILPKRQINQLILSEQ